MNTLIIANGPLPRKVLYRRNLKEADLILCADGGANRAMVKSIRPDFIIGDLDSILPEVRSQFKEKQLIYRPSQYATDLEKTLQFAVEKEVTNATIIGISGGRLDHQICNLNIIQKFSKQLEIQIIDNSGIGQFVHNQIEFVGRKGQQVSLFAFKKAEGITTQGLKYPIPDGSLEWAVTDGLSNEIVSNPVRILVRDGCLFLFREW